MNKKKQSDTKNAKNADLSNENLQENENRTTFVASNEIGDKESHKQPSSAMATDKYIRFDWAAKKILRDKSNFCILEGLITVLLGESVHILELLESESNQYDANDKYNRVDIKAKNSKDEIIIVEIQLTRELYYLERILYGVAKAITEHIQLGQKYDQVKKVYSISILYFDLGKGDDYVYRGQTVFRGLTKNDTLQITTKERDVINMKAPEEVFPEYYLIRVNAFDKIAETHLEEWIKYLKDGVINEDTTAPGLQEAKRKLEYMAMSHSEQLAYDEHLNAVMIQNDVISTAMKEGRAEGRIEGRAEGRAEGRVEGRIEGRAEATRDNAIALKKKGLSSDFIADCLNMSIEEVEALPTE